MLYMALFNIVLSIYALILLRSIKHSMSQLRGIFKPSTELKSITYTNTPTIQMTFIKGSEMASKEIEAACSECIHEEASESIEQPIKKKPGRRVKPVDPALWLEKFDEMLEYKRKNKVSDSVAFGMFNIPKDRWKKYSTEEQKATLKQLQNEVKSAMMKKQELRFKCGAARKGN